MNEHLEARAKVVNALTNMATVVNSGGDNEAIARAWTEVCMTVYPMLIELGVKPPSDLR